MVEGQGQLAGGGSLAEEQVCHSLTAPGAGIPGQHDGGCPVMNIGQVDGAAGHQQHDGGLAHFQNLVHQDLLGLGQHQVILIAGSGEVAGITLLAFHGLVQTNHQNNHITVLGNGDCFAQAVIAPGQTFQTAVPHMAAFGVQHTALACHGILDAFQGGDIAGRVAVVVTDQGSAAVGIGADDTDGTNSIRIQGQQAVILQQNAGSAGSFSCQIQVLFALDDFEGNVVELTAVFHDAQHIAGSEQTLGAGGDVLFGHQTLLVSAAHMQVSIAAVQVAAHLHCQSGSLSGSLADTVTFIEVMDGPAVGNHMALMAPLATEQVYQQGLAAAAGLAVDPVVSAHDGLDLGIHDALLKSAQVGLGHILGIGLGIEGVTGTLRTAVDSKVLGAGGSLQGLAPALEAMDIGLAQAGSQVGIFAVGLMTAAPAGITENVDIRGPVGQTLVDIPVAFGAGSIVLGAAFGSGHIAQTLQTLIVEHGSHADGLGEAGCDTGAGNTVEGFVPPVVGGDVQPLDGGSIVTELAHLLIQGHLGNQCLRFCACSFTIHKYRLLF